jgi:two-component system sensor histidine kinase QseC
VTRPAPSLRLRLTVAVLGVVGVALCLFSLVVYAAFGRALWRQFDERLAQDARAVANMVEERASGPWEFEPGAIEEFDRQHGAAYFEVWMDDGRVLARSSSLGTGDLLGASSRSDTGVAELKLPDGRKGHRLVASLASRHDEDGPPKPSGRRVRVAVARATDEVDATLATLRLLLGASGFVVLALAALASALAIRGGLAPVARLAGQIDTLDASRLGEILPVDDLPRELRPTVVKLNELLSRLEDSFSRERQFSADVSHELRTPLAGLRSMIEVAASRERPASHYRAALEETLVLVKQMNTLVENLLMLSRLEAHQVPIAHEEVAVRELVDESYAPFAAKALGRKLQFDNRVPAGTILRSDREKLRIVISNLLANAVEYTAEDGQVAVEGATSRAEILTVSDSGPAIPEDALDRIFDRFFRLDSSRSAAGEHCGVGLALTRALCKALDFSIGADNRSDGSVAFRIQFARASCSSEARDQALSKRVIAGPSSTRSAMPEQGTTTS